MKKARSRTVPTKESLREMPEVDFARYTVRPNRFAMRAKEEGIQLIHEGPSAASLAAIPEVDLAGARSRRGARDATVYLQVGKGRPRRGDEVGPTTVRSIRLPDAMWAALAARASRERLTVHAALRTAIVGYLEDGPRGRAPVPVARESGRRARRASEATKRR